MLLAESVQKRFEEVSKNARVGAFAIRDGKRSRALGFQISGKKRFNMSD